MEHDALASEYPWVGHAKPLEYVYIFSRPKIVVQQSPMLSAVTGFKLDPRCPNGKL